jgi:hypothetical protein
MKKSLFTFIPLLFIGLNSFEQCCPYVDPVEIIPANPTQTDSIYVVTNVTTPNQGAYLGYTIIESGNDILIEACYYNGLLTALQSYTDTINLGVKAAGTYDILFVAYQSGNDVTCDYSDSNQVSSSVTVTSTAAINSYSVDLVRIYPNPVTNGLIYMNLSVPDEAIIYRLYNTLGEVVLEGTASQTIPINVSAFKGVFYLSFFKDDEIGTQKILIL